MICKEANVGEQDAQPKRPNLNITIASLTAIATCHPMVVLNSSDNHLSKFSHRSRDNSFFSFHVRIGNSTMVLGKLDDRPEALQTFQMSALNAHQSHLVVPVVTDLCVRFSGMLNFQDVFAEHL